MRKKHARLAEHEELPSARGRESNTESRQPCSRTASGNAATPTRSERRGGVRRVFRGAARHPQCGDEFRRRVQRMRILPENATGVAKEMSTEDGGSTGTAQSTGGIR